MRREHALANRADLAELLARAAQDYASDLEGRLRVAEKCALEAEERARVLEAKLIDRESEAEAVAAPRPPTAVPTATPSNHADLTRAEQRIRELEASLAAKENELAASAHKLKLAAEDAAAREGVLGCCGGVRTALAQQKKKSPSPSRGKKSSPQKRRERDELLERLLGAGALKEVTRWDGGAPCSCTVRKL